MDHQIVHKCLDHTILTFPATQRWSSKLSGPVRMSESHKTEPKEGMVCRCSDLHHTGPTQYPRRGICSRILRPHSCRSEQTRRPPSRIMPVRADMTGWPTDAAFTSMPRPEKTTPATARIDATFVDTYIERNMCREPGDGEGVVVHTSSARGSNSGAKPPPS